MADRSFRRVNVTVYVNGPPSLTVVEWEWVPSIIPLTRYDIYVSRGESPEEMDLIAGPIPAELFTEYEDRSSRQLSNDRLFYYKVMARNKETGADIYAPLAQMNGVPDTIGNYVIVEHNFLFKQVIGLPSYVYKKQRQGDARCSNCWDTVLKRVNKSICTQCHGTGFVGRGIGGYYNPSYTWIDYSPDVQAASITQWGVLSEKQSDLFLSNYPILAVGDIIVELLGNKVWKVFMSRETERRRTPMLQIARADLMDQDSIEGQIAALVPDSIYERARTELNDRKYGKGY